MRITIVYDNGARRSNLKADWGFACVVDVGAGGFSLIPGPADRSAVQPGQLACPTSVHEIFISTPLGPCGVGPFLEAGEELKVYVPYSLPLGGSPRSSGSARIRIAPRRYSTGELQNREQAMA
jgi:hypothetical protein